MSSSDEGVTETLFGGIMGTHMIVHTPGTRVITQGTAIASETIRTSHMRKYTTSL